MSRSLPRIPRALQCAFLPAVAVIALTLSGGGEAVAKEQAPYFTVGYVDCGGLGEAPCDASSGFMESNGGMGCDRGLRIENDTCVNDTRRQPLNPGSDVTVGRNFARSWIGRALRIQRQDLNWATSFGRLSLIEAHNGFNNEADRYPFPNQKYSLTELLDAGIRSFEWDVHYDASLPGALPQLCHGESHHEGCAVADRDFFNGLKELRDWMVEPGHENEVVMFGLEYRVDENAPGDTDLDGDFLVTNVIARFLDTPDVGVLTETELDGYMNSHPTPERYSFKREWPSQQWLVETGNRVIFTGPGASRGPYFVDLSYGYMATDNAPPDFEVTNRSGSSYPNSQIDAWIQSGTGYPDCSMAVEHNGVSGYVKYLRPESGVFYTAQSDDDVVFGAATITPDLIAGLTACNVDQISFDNVLVDWGRMQAAVWSWEVDQPPANAAGLVARMARATGRWWAASGLDERPFLCRKETRQAVAGVQDLPVVDFAVSTTTGVFVDGGEACASLGPEWAFSPPLNGYENLQAKAVAENLPTDPYIGFIGLGDDRWAVWQAADSPQFTVDAPGSVREGDTEYVDFVHGASWTHSNLSCGGPGAELVEVEKLAATANDTRFGRERWRMSCRYLGGANRVEQASVTIAHAIFGAYTISEDTQVLNQPPVIGAIPDQSVVAGVPFQLTVDLADAPGETLGLRVDFDDDDDRMLFAQSPGAHEFSHVYAMPGTYTLLVVATDEASRAEALVTITVTSPPPVASITGPNRVSVGRHETFYVDTSDPDGGFASLRAASCGDAGVLIGTAFIAEAGPVRRYSVRCGFTAAAGSNEISITVIDDEQQEQTFPWVVRIGRAPTGSIEGPTSVAEGATASFTLRGSNTDGDDVQLVSIDCGQGTTTAQGDDVIAGINLRLDFSCRFGDSAADATSIAATVSDFDGDTEVPRQVLVVNAAPALAGVALPPSLRLGDDARVAGTTTDPGGDAVRVRVNWGDGSDQPVVDAVNSQFTAWHRFQSAGTYDVVVTPIDDEDLEGTPVTRSIAIADVVAPELHLPTLAPIHATGPLTEVHFDATATDNIDGVIPAICTPESGSLFAIGTHEVSCSAHDSSGNPVNGSFWIEVVDVTAPELTVADVTVTGSDPAVNGAPVTFAPVASDNVGVTALACVPASGATFPFGATGVTCTASDAAGNTTPKRFVVTVLDGVKPVVTVPANVRTAATSAGGAAVTFAASAADNVSGPLVASCSPASGDTFRIGTTQVTCTATDAAGNTGGATFSVTVDDVTTPGRMHGDGFIRKGDTRYEFSFRVAERASGDERGHFELDVKTDKPRGRKKDRGDDRDRFTAREITFIAFSDDPTYRPGRKRRPQIDTVRFSGTGSWNGADGCRFEVIAVDAGEPGRHREAVEITVWSPSGAVIAEVEGDLSGGNVQSLRIHR